MALRVSEALQPELSRISPILLVREIVNSRTINAHVRFMGAVSRDELRARYQASHVFVFPSYFEGFGLVLLEAMACGLPVITTDRDRGIDILDGKTGQLVAAGDMDALVESLRWFSKNRNELPAMRNAARAKAEQYTWRKYRDSVSKAVEPFV